MNLEALRAAFLARGFDYLTSEEANGYLNDAYLLDICEGEEWPFLEASKEGVAPVVLSDLRTVEYVTNTTQNTKLRPLLKARITDDWNPDLTESGAPELYYITAGTTVNVFPVSNTDEILVRYWKFPVALTGTATPLLPERWHSLIVDGAVARAYEKTDDQELATGAEGKFNLRLALMRESLLNLQHDQPDDYIVVQDPAAMR